MKAAKDEKALADKSAEEGKKIEKAKDEAKVAKE